VVLFRRLSPQNECSVRNMCSCRYFLHQRINSPSATFKPHRWLGGRHFLKQTSDTHHRSHSNSKPPIGVAFTFIRREIHAEFQLKKIRKDMIPPNKNVEAANTCAARDTLAKKRNFGPPAAAWVGDRSRGWGQVWHSAWGGMRAYWSQACLPCGVSQKGPDVE